MSTKKKGLINKDDLKRLMKQSASSSTTRKVDSPFAKYDSLDNLYCALCSTKVKNNLHWKAHVQGRSHKENVENLKREAARKQEATVQPPASHNKRAHSPASISQGAKKSRKDNGIATTSSKVPVQNTPATALRLAQYAASSSDEGSDTEETNMTSQAMPSSTKSTSVVSSQPAASNSALPTDFFDASVKPSPVVDEKQEPGGAEDPSMAEKLPEGFFDDPKQDAKAREVKYVDKDEEEWELFQRSIKEETGVSEQIQEVEDDEKQVDRNVSEIDEHIYHWSKIEALHDRKDEVQNRKGSSSQQQTQEAKEKDRDQILGTSNELVVTSKDQPSTSKQKAATSKEEDKESEDEDIDFSELIDWRTKRY